MKLVCQWKEKGEVDWSVDQMKKEKEFVCLERHNLSERKVCEKSLGQEVCLIYASSKLLLGGCPKL